MKKFLLGLLIAILGIAGTYYYLTLSIVTVADNFFASIKEDNLTKAESYLSDDFKKNTSSQELAQYLVNYNLHNYKKIKWGYKRVINIEKQGKEAKIEGTITNQQDITAPLKIHLTKEHGAWKIFAMEKILSPEEIKQQQLIANYTKLSRISMHTLAEAIKENNMTILHNNLSELWKKETTVKELKKTYGVFHEKKVNLLALDKVSPQLTQVGVDKKGILSITGLYRVSNNQVHFIQKYVAENKVWKLAGLSIEIK